MREGSHTTVKLKEDVVSYPSTEMSNSDDDMMQQYGKLQEKRMARQYEQGPQGNDEETQGSVFVIC